MQNFSLKTKKNSHHSFRRHLWIFVLSFCTFALLITVYGKAFVRSVTLFLVEPMYRVQTYMRESSATIPYFIRSRMEIQNEIDMREAELLLLRDYAVTIEALKKENETLRAGVAREGLEAGIIAQPPYTPYDTLLIDRGSDDGVVLHALVTLDSRIALGYVTHVRAKSSVVTLFSSPGHEMSVYVFGAHVFTTARGEGGGVVRVAIPQGLTVALGDMVVAPMFDVSALGAVVRVESVPSEPDQYAYVTFETPITSIRSVHVGLRPLHLDELNENLKDAEQSYVNLRIVEEGVLKSDAVASGTPSNPPSPVE